MLNPFWDSEKRAVLREDVVGFDICFVFNSFRGVKAVQYLLEEQTCT